MTQHEIGKIITAFFACAYRPALLGVPTEIFAFHFPFYKVFFIGVLAGLFGSFVSAFLSEELILFYNFLIKKIFPYRKKKIFTRMNRFYVSMQKYVSIAGIAALSPFLLSIPFGTFLAVRFFGYEKRKKIVLYITLSTTVWTLALYFLYHTLDVRFLFKR